MLIAHLFDPLGMGIVAGGTAVATALRSGRAELRDCAWGCACLLTPRFTQRQAQARLARAVAVIQRDGVGRGRFDRIDDPELDGLLDAVIHNRSLARLGSLCRERRAARARRSGHTAAALRQAAELAPVAGLGGTLVALALPGADGSAGGLTASVALAVLTTLYGLVLAHLVLLPLAALVERRAAADEAERLRVSRWLAQQLRGSVPDGRVEPPPGAVRPQGGTGPLPVLGEWEDAA